MTFPELIEEIRKLSRVERLQIMEALVRDLQAEEATLLDPNKIYQLYSPPEDYSAARVLMDALEADEERTDK